MNESFKDFEFKLEEVDFTVNNDWFECEYPEVWSLGKGGYDALNVYSTCGWGAGLGTATLPDFPKDYDDITTYQRDGVMINYASAPGGGSVT